MDFICKDFNTVLHSLSQIIGVSEDKIISILEYNWEKQFEIENRYFFESNDSEEPFPDDFGEYIFLKGFPEITLPIDRPTVHWFHGTRAIVPNDYLHDGILPLLEMYPKIKQVVDNIAFKLKLRARECESELQEHNKWLAEMKLSDSKNHGGPFAMLMFEAAATPEIFECHSYIDEPEIISNYAYMMYDTDADLILTEFKKISSPVIVEFIEPDNAAELIPLKHFVTAIIYYLYSKIHRKKIGLHGNICFSNNGQPISKKYIVNIHRIEKYSRNKNQLF